METKQKDKTNEVRVYYWKQVCVVFCCVALRCVMMCCVALFISANRFIVSIASDQKYATCNEWGWLVGQQVVSNVAEAQIHIYHT